MAVISVRNAEHYGWQDRCDGWHLVRAEGLSGIQERMPPGTSEVPHRHSRARQFFFVVEGTLSIAMADAVHRLERNEGLEIPPGAGHRVFNDSSADVQFLVISAPPAQGDRLACDEPLANA